MVYRRPLVAENEASPIIANEKGSDLSLQQQPAKLLRQRVPGLVILVGSTLRTNDSNYCIIRLARVHEMGANDLVLSRLVGSPCLLIAVLLPSVASKLNKKVCP